VVVYGEAVRIRIGGGTRGVEEDEDAEVSGKLPALQVDMFGRAVAGAQVDEQIDEGLDVEVVAIGPAAEDLGAEAQAGQAGAKPFVVGNAGGGGVGGGARWESDPPAGLRRVGVVVDTPLGVEATTPADGGAGRAVGGEAETGGGRRGARPPAPHPPHRPNRQ